MKTIVFCGPTVSFDDVREHLPGAMPRCPAACGDVYRAVRERPDAIVLVDGFFEHRLAIWHKEILWALSEGISVYGAASMGALRAAEMHAFGMIGVGRIFEQFRDGVLEDDDEVAIVHHPGERGFLPQSEAMVNLRTTLEHAERAGVIDSAQRMTLVSRLKGLFYPERDVPRLLAFGRELVDSTDFDAFESWIARHGVVDQKRLDALAVLARVEIDARAKGTTRGVARSPVRVEATDAWETLRRKLDGESSSTTRGSPARRDDASPIDACRGLEDPLRSGAGLHRLLGAFEAFARVNPDLAERARLVAAQRALAVRISEREQVTIDASDLQAASERFRRRRELLTPEKTSRWMRDHVLDVPTFSALVHDTELVRRLQTTIDDAMHQELGNALRVMGLLTVVLDPHER